MSSRNLLTHWKCTLSIAVHVFIAFDLHTGVFVSIARGCGQCLNFNPVVVVFLMMRRGLTWLRSTRLAAFLPLDQHIELHKLVGFVIFVFSTIHVIAHLSNFSKSSTNNVILISTYYHSLTCSTYSRCFMSASSQIHFTSILSHCTVLA